MVAPFRIACMLVGLMLSGCVTSGVVKTDQPPTAMHLVPDQSLKGDWSARAPSLPDSRESMIHELCGPSKDPKAAAAGAAVLGIVIPIAIDWVLGEIDAALKRELERYTKTYTATWYGRPPKSFTANSGSGQAGCIRIVRFGPGDAAELDFVARVAPAMGGDALMIQPLRLYVGKAYAKGDDVTVAIGLKADAVWSERNVGRSATVFDDVLITRKFSPAAPVWYHPMLVGGNRNDWTEAKTVPLLARSIGADGSVGNVAAPVTLTATIAENGVPPALLKKLAELFSAKKGDIGKAASDAIVKRLTEQPAQ